MPSSCLHHHNPLLEDGVSLLSTVIILIEYYRDISYHTMVLDVFCLQWLLNHHKIPNTTIFALLCRWCAAHKKCKSNAAPGLNLIFSCCNKWMEWHYLAQLPWRDAPFDTTELWVKGHQAYQ